MQFGGGQYGVTAFATGPEALDGVASPFYELLEYPKDLVLLLSIPVYDPDLPGIVTVKSQWSNSNKEWRGGVSDTDYYPFRLEQPVNLKSQLFAKSPFALNQTSSTRFGDIKIALDSEDAEDFTRYNWNGRPVTILMGRVDFKLSEFEPLLEAEVNDVSWDEDTITIKITEPAEVIRVDIQTNVYAGTGGDGDPKELKDQKKPLCFGICRQISPVLVDPARFIYQIHDGPVEEIINVYQGGLEYNVGGSEGDFANLAALIAWVDGPPAPSGGTWATCQAEGYFALVAGETFGKAITVDIRGDADVALGGFVSSLSDVCKRILLQRTILTETDLVGFSKLGLDQPSNVGLYYQDGGDTVQDAIGSLLNPLLCYFLFNRQGDLTTGQIQFQGATQTLQEPLIKSISRLRTILPHAERTVGYNKSWTVISDDGGFLESAPEDNKLFLRQEHRKIKAERIGSTNNLREELSVVNTLLSSIKGTIEETTIEAEAEAEGERQIALADFPDLFKVTIDKALLLINPGETVLLIHNRFGLSGGRVCIVVEVTENIKLGELSLVLWG
jgi:hypothetical protein